MMGTPDIRVDTNLNKHVWSKGIRYEYCSLQLQTLIMPLFDSSVVSSMWYLMCGLSLSGVLLIFQYM